MNEKSARETANREENKDTELKVDDDSTPQSDQVQQRQMGQNQMANFYDFYKDQ